jgi:small subunit ribosomal protein S1
VKVGEELTVMVIEVDRERERVSLGLKQTLPNPWEGIEKRFPVGAKVHGKVVNLVAYGAFIELETGVEGLVHVSELSWTKRVQKPSDVLKVGQEVDAIVLSVNTEEQKISLGVRQLETNPWEMVRHNYPVGARVRGKVRNLTNYGAFVELEEGIDGMVHVSDMSWTRRITNPGDHLKKGDEVEALVLDVDVDQQRISLGIKQTMEDPWSVIDRTYHVGDVVKGKVSKIANFGAFIELSDDIDGLVHVSQISEERVENVKDALKTGQEVSARVIKIDKEERRIGLSIKAANYDAERLQAEISNYDRIKGPSTGPAPTGGQSTGGGSFGGGDFNSLGDLLDKAGN